MSLCMYSQHMHAERARACCGCRLPSTAGNPLILYAGMARTMKSRAYRRLYIASKPVRCFPLQAQGLELGVICEIVLSKGQLHVAALQSRTSSPFRYAVMHFSQ